jgi:hypothetical protein
MPLSHQAFGRLCIENTPIWESLRKQASKGLTMKHQGDHFGQSMREESSRGIYRNQVEVPEMAAQAHAGPGQGAMPSMGCMEFKGQADSIAMGQAGGPGCKQDNSRIHSQFKDYHWD